MKKSSLKKAIAALAGGAIAGIAITAGLQLTGAFGDGDEPAADPAGTPAIPPLAYLGQDALAICVDTFTAPGAAQNGDAAGTSGTVPFDSIDLDDLENAVNEAIDFGQFELWVGTYLEDAPIEVAQGCPLEPLPYPRVHRFDQPTSRFSIYVYLVDEATAAYLGAPLVPRGPGALTIEIGPPGADYTEIEFLSYALLVGPDHLTRVRSLANAIGGAYGSPSGGVDEGEECDPGHPRCVEPNETPPALDEEAPSG